MKRTNIHREESPKDLLAKLAQQQKEFEFTKEGRNFLNSLANKIMGYRGTFEQFCKDNGLIEGIHFNYSIRNPVPNKPNTTTFNLYSATEGNEPVYPL